VGSAVLESEAGEPLPDPARVRRGAATLDDIESVFIPGDPPRAARIALVRLGENATPEALVTLLAETSGGRPGGGVGEVELALPSPRRPSRRSVTAVLLSPELALQALLDLAPAARESTRVWGAVLTAGLGLIARGRIMPAVTQAGFDAWRVGPLDPADERLLLALAAALPPIAHAAILKNGPPPATTVAARARAGALMVTAPAAAVRAVWDALADGFVRTPAAAVASGMAPFACEAPQPAAHLSEWLSAAESGLEGGATVALRLELADLAGGDPDGDGDDDDDAADGAGEARAIVQLQSRADPSLVVDAADLFSSPAAVLARFGDEAETDLLLALRRGARAWPPLAPLLRERAPSELAIAEDELADLLGEAAHSLAGAGINVLWPSELLHDAPVLRAVATPPPGALADAGLTLTSLLEFRWEVTLGGVALSEEELDQLAEAKRGIVRLRGRYVVADPALLERLRRRRTRTVAAGQVLAALLGGGLAVEGEVVPIRVEGPLAALAGRLSSAMDAAPDADLAPPAGLAAELRPYQLRGVAWLRSMYELGLGSCLADDMGLGKTIQVIALHLHLHDDHMAGKRHAGRRPRVTGLPTLVICPTSVIGNWEREVKRFAPSIPVRRYHGPGRNLDALAQDEIVLATYGIARRDRAALAAAGFALVVADEAQNAKNPHSDTARAIRAIDAQVRVALSGTPVENQLTDLWSILDWAVPGLLGALGHFRATVAVPIERYRDPVVTDRLARCVRPFLLRRRKTDPDIAPDLPPRTVTDLPVPLTVEQVTLYEAEVREGLDAIAEREGIARRGLVLRLLSRLKQICNHPAQFLHQKGPVAGRSGKLTALEELLELVVSEGDSVLVFSQYVQCCALLEARIGELGIATLFLHGGTAARRREEIVASFQAGAAPVLLLSLKAGGVGLNLTRATHVVHYDRWWNPAVEDQATDRAHRIGQDRPVQVHRLIAEGTVEDRIAELLERKRLLAESIVGAGEGWITELSDDELADLVRLGAS
jgi:superfamily II DNA or RNA helicase